MQMMTRIKYSVLTFFLLLLPTILLGGDIDNLSIAYLKAFSEKNFQKAANLMHCPENYSAEEKTKDINSIGVTT